MDALATEYATRPVLFLEQSVDFPVGSRYDRWWAAYGSGASAYLPLIMVDSGHQLSSGSQKDFKATYRPLVNAELIRPPAAEIEAYSRQVGSRMRVYVKLRNDVGTTLSVANGAAIHALVWEDKRVSETGRYVRAAPWAAIATAVPPGGETTTTLETPNLTGVGWTALHTVVLADYLPGPGPAYDMVQAAIAEPAGLSADPETSTVAVDAGHPADVSIPVRLRGPYVLSWSAAAGAPWITVSPEGGALTDRPTVTVVAGALVHGWQEAVVNVAATSEDGMSFAQPLTVRAFLGSRVVRAPAITAAAGEGVHVPLDLAALGNENTVSFTIAWEPSAFRLAGFGLFGAITPDMLTLDGSQAAVGRLGVTLTLPPGQTFNQGDVRLMELHLSAAPAATGGTFPFAFGDEPVTRQVLGTGGAPLTASFEDGSVTIPIVASRPPRRHLGR